MKKCSEIRRSEKSAYCLNCYRDVEGDRHLRTHPARIARRQEEAK